MKPTRQEHAQRTRITDHCVCHQRLVIDEYTLILEKKSDLSKADRDYLVKEVEEANERAVKLEENRNRKINNLK